MAKFILGKKLNMTQKFQEDGTSVAVTVLEAGPCTVVQTKGEKEGYNAVQVGFGKKNKASKSLKGHLKDLNVFKYLREFRVEDSSKFERAKVFDLSSFVIGEKITIQAISKGRGFQGVVKRHGFHGSPASHGHKDQLRMPGSIGATDAARVFKGTRMGGRMGSDTVTIPSEIIDIDVDNNLVYIKGAVPGSRNTLVKLFAKDGELIFVEAKKEEVKPEAKKEETDKEEAPKSEEKKADDKKEEVKPEAKKEETDKEEAPKSEEKKADDKKVENPDKDGGKEVKADKK